MKYIEKIKFMSSLQSWFFLWARRKQQPIHPSSVSIELLPCTSLLNAPPQYLPLLRGSSLINPIRHGMFSIRAARPCRSVSKHRIVRLSGRRNNSPEAPARVRRLAAPVAAVNLAIKPLDAIVIPKVEALVGVLVLDLEQRSQASRLGAHALCLARREVAGEHAAVASAGKIDPSLGLARGAPTPCVAASHRDFCVDGRDDGEGESGGDLHGGWCVFGEVCGLDKEGERLILMMCGLMVENASGVSVCTYTCFESLWSLSMGTDSG